MSVKIVPAYEFPGEIRALFTEYTNMLIAGDPAILEYLDLQNYGDEFRHLQVKYGMPYGRLYLAYCDEKPAGCVGLRKIDDKTCEMKRLYVRPEFRGRQIGGLLVGQIVSDAKEIGYSHLLLDTLPFLQSAIRLYKKAGFYEIPCYNNSPMNTSIYMELDL